MEGLEDGIKEVIDVRLEDTGLFVVDSRNVRLYDVLVRSADEVEAAVAHLRVESIKRESWARVKTYRISLDDVVPVYIVCSRADGVCTSNIGRGVGDYGETSRHRTTEPVGSESLVTEDVTKSVAAQLGGGAIGEELEDESDFREGSEDTGGAEFELFVLLLILVEAIELELLEDFVVDYRVVSRDGVAVTVSPDVVEKGVEEVILEVDAIADGVVATRGGDIT